MAGLQGLTNLRFQKKYIYILLFLLLLVVINVFLYSYLTKKEVGGILQPVLGDNAEPLPQFMIYGGFGDKQFNKPMSVTHGNGKIYVSDTNNGRVQVFNDEGTPVRAVGEKGTNQGQFEFPYGVAVDSKDQLYVADLYNGSVSVFDAQGKFIKYFAENKPLDSVIEGPGGLFLKDNRLYVTDINASQVKVFDLSGKLLFTLGNQRGNGDGQLNAPNAVTVDAKGNILVVDTGNQRVNIYDPNGKFVRSFNGSPNGKGESVFVNPRGIGIDSKGRLFVISSITHYVHVFDENGKEIMKLGGLGDQLNQFILPNGLYVDENDRIYVTDTGNQRVAVYR